MIVGCVTKSEIKLGPQDLFSPPTRATASNAGMAAIVIRQINADNVRRGVRLAPSAQVAVESFSFGAHLVRARLAASASDSPSIAALSPEILASTTQRADKKRAEWKKWHPLSFTRQLPPSYFAQIGEREGWTRKASEPTVNLVRFDSILCARAPTAAPAGTSDGRMEGEEQTGRWPRGSRTWPTDRFPRWGTN